MQPVSPPVHGANGPGRAWDFVMDGVLPQRVRPLPACIDDLLSARTELLSDKCDMATIVRHAGACFDPWHGESSANLTSFLETGRFSSKSAPADLDDLQRCLHKLAWAYCTSPKETATRLSAFCSEQGEGMQGARATFWNVLHNLPACTYACLVARAHGAFGALDGLDEKACVALTLT